MSNDLINPIIAFLGAPLSCLVKLPKSFVELYSIINRVKGHRSDDADDDGGCETAICLLTGSVMRSGTARRSKPVSRLHIYANTFPYLFP